MRQNATRLPYSCHAQFGTSGVGDPPAGGVSTVRGIVSSGFHSSILTMIHTATRAWFGSASGLRWEMGEKLMRSVGSTSGLLRTNGNRQPSNALDGADKLVSGMHGANPGRRAGEGQVACLELVLVREIGNDLRHVPDQLREVAALALRAVHRQGDRAAARVTDRRGQIDRAARRRL